MYGLDIYVPDVIIVIGADVIMLFSSLSLNGNRWAFLFSELQLEFLLQIEVKFN